MLTGEEFGRPPIRVDMELDLYGLDPYQFRLYGHIARRRECFSNLKTMAAICKMSVRQAQYALKSLESLSLITKERRPGKTDLYRVAPRDKWQKQDYSSEFDNALSYFNRGIVRRELKDLEGALMDFQKAAKIYQEDINLAKQSGRESIRKQKDLEDTQTEIKKLREKLQLKLMTGDQD